jgi:bis(5'-nucleosyl)-tetraphosphatase (symmetrical)
MRHGGAAMATYAIGDIHGCYTTLQRLLRRLEYDPRRDRLWLVGDLVNRGPRSRAVLRWAAGLDPARVIAVLGNHDLHLLARAEGLASPRRRDTLDGVLGARDRDALLAWLRDRPLLHREGEWAMVHAGLLPEWTLRRAGELAAEAEAQLRSAAASRLLATFRGDPPGRFRETLSPAARRRLALGVLTRVRTLNGRGRMTDFSGPPLEAPSGYTPWFAHRGRKSRGTRIVFGHWAAPRGPPGLPGAGGRLAPQVPGDCQSWFCRCQAIVGRSRRWARLGGSCPAAEVTGEQPARRVPGDRPGDRPAALE